MRRRQQKVGYGTAIFLNATQGGTMTEPTAAPVVQRREFATRYGICEVCNKPTCSTTPTCGTPWCKRQFVRTCNAKDRELMMGAPPKPSRPRLSHCGSRG